MRLIIFTFILLPFIILINSCNQKVTTNTSGNSALKSVYQYYDELSNNEFKFSDLDYKLNSAKGNNNQEEVDKYIKEFETLHEKCIKKMETKFPQGSVKIPYVQKSAQDTLTIKSAYISGYAFPWNTALDIGFFITIEYDLHKKDLLYTSIPIKFIDTEDDVIYLVHCKANNEGKSRMEIRAQFTFRELKNIVIYE